jgi:hypothetical protein
MESEVYLHGDRHSQALPQHVGGGGIGFGGAVVHHDYGIVAMAEFGYPSSMAGGNLYRTSQSAAQRLSDPGSIGHGADDQDIMLYG